MLINDFLKFTYIKFKKKFITRYLELTYYSILQNIVIVTNLKYIMSCQMLPRMWNEVNVNKEVLNLFMMCLIFIMYYVYTMIFCLKVMLKCLSFSFLINSEFFKTLLKLKFSSKTWNNLSNKT